ncbi:hypothetical protein PanWU01x14_168060 [Parasponia andersonii]|uniref:Transmembrane protein n=1 Tax=Parasponia andersonii TaxID=3476 RepID=A0A2P5CAZ7_PARAD|nr:hypothetical protein PanWU01x14_168060 [Parasponia andersonii]
MGASHKPCSLKMLKIFNNARPVAMGVPTETKILTIILSNTTCGISSSLAPEPLPGFWVAGVSFVVCAGVPGKPLALAFALWALLVWFGLFEALGMRRVVVVIGLLGFHGEEFGM